MNELSPNSHSLVQWVEPGQLLRSLSSGQLLMVDPQRHNALIICKTFHAEFAGPGAAVGGPLDVESSGVVPIGNVALVQPQGYQERQNAYAKRLHWMRWLQQITDNPLSTQRARILLFSLEEFFSAELVSQLPDEVLARLVGVLPQTIAAVRREVSCPTAKAGGLRAAFP